MTEIETSRYKLNKEIVEIHIDLLVNFTKALAYYRAINQDFSRIERNSKFWLFTMNTNYLRAITDWCIIFGADSNESHWKKVSQVDRKIFLAEIRSLVKSSAKISESTWKDYHNQIVDFRNGYAAHRNVMFKENVPDLGVAYEIAKGYFEWLKEQLRPSSNEPKDLNELFANYQIEILGLFTNDLKKI